MTTQALKAKDVGLKVSAILLLGGLGRRFNHALPKQFHLVYGKPLYMYTLQPFLEIAQIRSIILVVASSYLSMVRRQTSHLPRVKVVEGGSTRQLSSYLGLQSCPKDTEIVVIHDGVRPLVSKKVILDHLQVTPKYEAVNTCIPSSDTLVQSRDQMYIHSIPKREHFMRGQTPQSFAYSLIVKAHQQATRQDASCDCSLVQNHHPIAIVEGEEINLKITSRKDLLFFKQYLQYKSPQTPDAKSQLKGKKYIITGATGGIGSAIEKLLRQEEAVVIPLSRTTQLPCDLKYASYVKKTFHQLHKQHGLCDGLINCVGFLQVKPFQQLNMQEINNQLTTNFTSIVHCCKYAQIVSGGHILNLGSSSFNLGRKNYAIYSASKAALVNFTQGLAQEWEHLQINALLPERTNTSMRTKNFPEENRSTLLSPLDVAEKAVMILKQRKFSGALVEVNSPTGAFEK